jgi:hypothetical protein
MSDRYEHKYDEGKTPYDLIPEICVREIYRAAYMDSRYVYASVFATICEANDITFYKAFKGVKDVLVHGIEKYGKRDGWKDLVDPQQRYMAADMRHLESVSESGIEAACGDSALKHINHKLCNTLFLLWFEINEEEVTHGATEKK